MLSPLLGASFDLNFRLNSYQETRKKEMTLDIFIQTMIAEVQFHFLTSMVETFSDQTKPLS